MITLKTLILPGQRLSIRVCNVATSASEWTPLAWGSRVLSPAVLTGCLTVAVFGGWGTPARGAELSCLKCHADQRIQFGPSAHAQAGLVCTDCHGGDGKVTDETAD